MAQRLTNTEKWDDDWFLGLPPKFKVAWEYIRDNCDGSGFEKISFKKMSDMIGDQITRDEFDSYFSEKIHWVSSDTFWIPGFLKEQYKTISIRNLAQLNMTKKILRTLQGQDLRGKALAVFNDLETIIHSSTDAQPALDRGSHEAQPALIGERIKVIGNRIKDKGKILKNGWIEKFEEARALYIVNTKGANAEERFAAQIKTEDDFVDLLKSIQHYRAHLEKAENDWLKPKQTFATYLGTKASGFFWRDWINPEAGEVNLKKPVKGFDIDTIELK